MHLDGHCVNGMVRYIIIALCIKTLSEWPTLIRYSCIIIDIQLVLLLVSAMHVAP